MNKKSHVTLRSSGDADLRALVYRMQLRLSSTSSRWCPGFFCRETYSAHLSWSMFQEPSHYDWQARREKFSLLVSCATEPKYLLSRKNVCVSSSGETMCSSFFFFRPKNWYPGTQSCPRLLNKAAKTRLAAKNTSKPFEANAMNTRSVFTKKFKKRSLTK